MTIAWPASVYKEQEGWLGGPSKIINYLLYRSCSFLSNTRRLQRRGAHSSPSFSGHRQGHPPSDPDKVVSEQAFLRLLGHTGDVPSLPLPLTAATPQIQIAPHPRSDHVAPLKVQLAHELGKAYPRLCFVNRRRARRAQGSATRRS
jgi:hypothetical protein